MMFYGWGKRTRTWPTPDGRWVSVTYRYVHIMFIFRAVLGVKWFLLEQNRSNDRRVTRADVEALCNQSGGLRAERVIIHHCTCERW